MAEVQRGTAEDDEFQIRDGLLIRRGALYVPGDDLRAKVLQQLHDAPTAGHFGKEKTVELVARDFGGPRCGGKSRITSRGATPAKGPSQCTNRRRDCSNPCRHRSNRGRGWPWTLSRIYPARGARRQC
ncbi:Hypothetical predicted protein [Podarcis lilfordi]|uniref:Integrase zinc-binding domain-containing protein n=1 Tax=Podarcis lilfordi TaxID=74358 RepID=A0AA35L0F4_9SAUR|nr:Hypothetical predicted protein [Podarcis lilfordi]